MWFWLALGSAVIGAIDLVISKKALRKVSAAVLAFSIFALTIPILIVMSFFEGTPSSNWFFLIGTLVSSLVFVFSKTITNEVLKQNIISKVLPLTAFAGFFTYIFGLIFLSESIKQIPLFGLILVLLGAYILNVDQAREDLLKPFKLLFLKKESLIYLFAIMLGGLTVILDKWALSNTFPSSPTFTLLIEQIFMSILLGAYMLRKENKTYALEIKNNFKILSLNSATNLLTGFLIFYAYSFGGPVALVVGVKRLQIFLILLMSYIFFKDKPTKHVWVATVIMILGVLMIKLG
jgi:drug/metabolite transporter (DMT)-like permease